MFFVVVVFPRKISQLIQMQNLRQKKKNTVFEKQKNGKTGH